MGGPSSSGAGGSDAGFENTTKSKLSKKNQNLVDASFDQRGKVKIDQAKILPPTVALFKGPFKKGSEVTRNFFTEKVLGSKNYKGTTKEDFAKMSVSQQESIFGEYMKGRQTGNTDAYGNPTNRDSRNNSKSIEQPKVASQMNNSNVKSKLIVADKVAPTTAEMSEDDRMVAIKRGKRTKTVLTKDYNEQPTLSKKALLA